VVYVEETNNVIGSFESAYYGLGLNGFYMPKISSAEIIGPDLLGIML
jgi:hypothetical protein